MRVIIAGGSGLIGRELASLLIAGGDDVVILSRSPHKVVGLSSGVSAIRWDGQTVGDWVQSLETADAIVNLTGENIAGAGLVPSRWTEKRKALLLDSRVDAGKILASALEAAKHKPDVFIQASGIGYYGTQQPKTLTEADAAGNDYLANLSVTWEASTQPVENLGVRRVAVRNGVVLSPRGGALPKLVLPYKLYVGGPLGSGAQVYSWIHIADEVSAIQFLLRNSQAAGIFNLTAPHPVTNDEFGRTTGRVLKRPHYFPIPGIAMQLVLGEVASTVLEGQKVIPQRLLDAGFVFKYPFLEDALKDLLAK